MLEIYYQKLEKLNQDGYRLLKPLDVIKLSHKYQWHLARSWVKTLDAIGGINTFHPKPEVIAELMSNAHAAILIDGKRNFVSGAKIQPWALNHQTNKIEEVDAVSTIVHPNYSVIATELGGIVTVKNEQGKGCGAVVTEAIAESALSIYHGPQVSVVRQNNFISANIFRKLSWHQLDEEAQQSLLGFDLLGDDWRGSLVFCNPKSIKT